MTGSHTLSPPCRLFHHYVTSSCTLRIWNRNLTMFITTQHKNAILVKPGYILCRNCPLVFPLMSYDCSASTLWFTKVPESNMEAACRLTLQLQYGGVLVFVQCNWTELPHLTSWQRRGHCIEGFNTFSFYFFSLLLQTVEHIKETLWQTVTTNLQACTEGFFSSQKTSLLLRYDSLIEPT